MSAGADVVEYDVLFYKRSAHSKVHKSKGVSKIDGILSVDLTRQTISLRCADEDKEDESSEDEKVPWKDRRKKSAKSAPSGIVYSGKQPSGNMTQLQDDTTVVLGNFEVEIVSCRSPSNAIPLHNPLHATPKGLLRKTAPGAALKPLLPVKRKALPSTLQRQPPPQPQNSVSKSKLPSTLQRKPPPQPQNAVSQVTLSSSLPHRRPLPEPRKLPPKVMPKIPIVKRHSNLLRPKVDNLTGVTTTSLATHPKLAARSAPSTFNTPTVAASSVTVLPHIPLPGNLRTLLRPHQVEGVDFLWRALTEHNGAILADEMGLGKSLQSIAIVAAWFRTQRAHSHIVVCPSSLVRNWEDEFNKWLGKASQPQRIVIRMGGADGLHRIRSFAENQSSKRSNRVGQVLIISYDLFRMHTNVIQQAVAGSIGVLICDEAHRLKNTKGSQTMTALDSLEADSRLLISASPVQNNLSEFYCLVNFARPGLLGELSAFRKDFERPIVAANRKNATPAAKELASRQSRRLEVLTKSTILRRLQAEVLAKTLPPRVELLLFCRLSNEQMRLYQSASQSAMKQLASTDALEALTNLRKLCTHPSLVQGTEDRANLNESGKLVVLSALLNEMRRSDETNKVVVVSNFTSALSLIEELVLKPNDLTYIRLDGNIQAQKRQLLVDTFNRTSASRSFCFLLSAKAGGCGLNLVGANKLVLFEPDWNPSVSEYQLVNFARQCMRAFRRSISYPICFCCRRTCNAWDECTARDKSVRRPSIVSFRRGQ